MRLISKMPTLAAIAYKTAKGEEFFISRVAAWLKRHVCLHMHHFGHGLSRNVRLCCTSLNISVICILDTG